METMLPQALTPLEATAFDEAVLGRLRKTYAPDLEAVIERLKSLSFHYEVFEVAHRRQVERRELLFRHAVPYLLVVRGAERETEESSEEDRGCLATLLLAHTLALTQLDYHMDGAAPPSDKTTAAVWLEPATASAYASRMMLEAMSVADDWCGSSSSHVRSVITEVSGFVLERMLQDTVERYDLRFLHGDNQIYLQSPTSRLMASGYWELMLRVGAHRHHLDVSAKDLVAIRRFRRLRQVVDEIADLDEDVAAGLSTLPVRFAAAAEPHGEIASLIADEWSIRRPTGDARTTASTARIAGKVRASPAYARALAVAVGLVRSLDEHIAQDQSLPLNRALRILTDLKLAWLCEVEPATKVLMPAVPASTSWLYER